MAERGLVVAHRMILDAGAVIAITRGNRAVRRMIASARADGYNIVIPPVVLTQTLRGGAQDAAVQQVLRSGRTTFIGARVARLAGQLLGAAGLNDAVDALVMAEAVRGGPCVVLTSDPDDLRALAGTRPYIRIVAV